MRYARPIGAGRTRFCRGPSLMKQRSMYRSSTSTFSDFWLALATADFTVFSISRVAPLFVNFNVIRASLTFLPRIRSMTSRAFCGDIGMYRLVALLIILETPALLLPDPYFDGAAAGVTDLSFIALPPPALCPLNVRVGENSPSL